MYSFALLYYVPTYLGVFLLPNGLSSVASHGSYLSHMLPWYMGNTSIFKGDDN